MYMTQEPRSFAELRNIECEQLVLGSALNNNESLRKVRDFLLPNHFYEPIHQKIFESLIKFYDQDRTANPEEPFR